MAWQALSGLSIGERVAMPFLESLARQKLGKNEILRRYRAATAGVLERIGREQPELLPLYRKHLGKIRRTRGLKLIGWLREQESKRPYALSLTSRARPTIDRLPYGKLGMGHQYAYKFRAIGTGIDGSRTEQWVTVTTDRLVPWGDLVGDAAYYFEGTAKSGGMSDFTITHQDIIRRPEEPGPV